MMAENCPADCPSTGSGDARANCPIRMAAMAIRGMIGQLHGSIATTPTEESSIGSEPDRNLKQ